MPRTLEITRLRVDRGGATVIDALSLGDGGVVTGLLGPSGGG